MVDVYTRLSSLWYTQCACGHYGTGKGRGDGSLVSVCIDGHDGVRLCSMCRMYMEASSPEMFKRQFYDRMNELYAHLPKEYPWLFNYETITSKNKLKSIKWAMKGLHQDSVLFNEFLLRVLYPLLWDARSKEELKVAATAIRKSPPPFSQNVRIPPSPRKHKRLWV